MTVDMLLIIIVIVVVDVVGFFENFLEIVLGLG